MEIACKSFGRPGFGKASIPKVPPRPLIRATVGHAIHLGGHRKWFQAYCDFVGVVPNFRPLLGRGFSLRVLGAAIRDACSFAHAKLPIRSV